MTTGIYIVILQYIVGYNNNYLMQKSLDTHLSKFEPDDKLIIWKYMSFDYFVYMIVNKVLYLSRADNNPIYFEGLLSTEDEKKLGQYYKNDNFANPLESARKAIECFELLKCCTFIDSWHCNDEESFAMWKIYGKSNNAIAIKSQVSKLKDIYNNTVPDCYLAEINYFTKEEPIDFFNNLLMFMRKPVFFEFEKEIRGIIQFDYTHSYKKYPFQLIPINENFSFINEIVLSPYCSDWLFETTASLLKQNNISCLSIRNSTYRINEQK